MNLLAYLNEHGTTLEELQATAISRTENKLLVQNEDEEKTATRPLNIQRVKRILATYTPTQEALTAIQEVREPLNLLILTEDWCGDSAQVVPVIVKLVSGNPLIRYGLLPRDEHPEIMDRFLTNGTRSIPVIAGLDESGSEVFRWGSRPKEAQQLVLDAKSAGIPANVWHEQLHLWYAKNKGAAIEKEFVEVLQSIMA